MKKIPRVNTRKFRANLKHYLENPPVIVTKFGKDFVLVVRPHKVEFKADSLRSKLLKAAKVK